MKCKRKKRLKGNENLFVEFIHKSFKILQKMGGAGAFVYLKWLDFLKTLYISKQSK